MKPLRHFTARTEGNVAMLFAFVVPMLLLMVGGAIDFLAVTSQRRVLQAAADAAALAGAKELSLASTNTGNVASIVGSVVSNYITVNAPPAPGAPSLVITPSVIDVANQPLQVQVQIAQPVVTAFKIFSTTLNVNAVAVVVGKPNICVLALDPSSMGTIYLQKNSTVIGNNCAVFSNSIHSNSIMAFNSSVLQASFICSAGGHAGTAGNFTPEPLNDCPQFSDPLIDRVEPSPGFCSATNLVITNQNTSLLPGTYCGGITINGSSSVAFKPGVYIISGGPLYIDQLAKVSGTNTGFYFTGANARFYFGTGTTVDLTAPKDGIMAGMLFFGSRYQSGLTHEILSDNAHQLLGTIYLPTGSLSIDANQPIADQSAYTAIVAKKLTANSGPTITLNTNYTLTDVPVPDGIRGAGQPAALAR